MESLLSIDRSLFLLINSGLSHPVFDVIGALLSLFGQGYMLAIFGFFGLYIFDKSRFPKNYIVFALVLLLNGALVQGIKHTVDKPRPLGDKAYGERVKLEEHESFLPIFRHTVYAVNPESEYANVGDGKVYVNGGRYTHRGFPSGHTAAAFGMATCLIYAFRRRRRYLWLLVALAMGFARIQVGVHFPGDVLFGAIIGVVVPYALLKRTEKYHGLGARRPKALIPPAPDPVIMMVAGEASADTYGANLIRAVKEQSPNAAFFGVGGQSSKDAGLEVIHDSKDLSIVGFTGVVTAAHRIRRIYKDLLKEMKQRRPQALVTIDLPDFNLMLAAQANSMGVRVMYYISPQIWAWRTGRIKSIAEKVDRMVVAFPFEKPMYEKEGVPTIFAGHPLLETLKTEFASDADARKHFGLKESSPVIVVAPGSRKNEIKYLVSTLFEAGALLQKDMPEATFAVPVAPHVDVEQLKTIASEYGFKPVFTKDHFHDLLNIATFGLVTSGTATLEAALFRCPMLIIYKGHPLNVAIARRMINIDMIGLPNIIAGDHLFPEVIQEEATGPALAKMAQEIIQEPETYKKYLQYCDRVRDALSGGDTSGKVAKELLDLIGESEIGADGQE